MSTDFLRLRLTRAGILLILAALVALLGATAKHSQYDSPPNHGYLSKAVKMAGARVPPDAGSPTPDPIESPVEISSPVHVELTPLCVWPVSLFTPVSISSPPLRA